MSTPLEVAVFSSSSAIHAQLHGAKRIELNAPGSYATGGTTFPVAQFKALGPQLTIPVRLMIRPRGAPASGPDFIYSDDEFQEMVDAIYGFKRTQMMDPVRGDGFVFGILRHKDGSQEGELEIDFARCATLMEVAQPFKCVFHRAYDLIAQTDSWRDGLIDLISNRFDGVLTSGGLGDYYNNLRRLEEIHQYADGQLQIIVGGGVRHTNISESLPQLSVSRNTANLWIHSSCKGVGEEVDDDEVAALVSALGSSIIE
ncbi:hypothetical protein G7046_g5110 [Stylonectria norvegica]|nr:hypothetical protein G7046_g5110 [Stylonectria norvegica]